MGASCNAYECFKKRQNRILAPWEARDLKDNMIIYRKTDLIYNKDDIDSKGFARAGATGSELKVNITTLTIIKISSSDYNFGPGNNYLNLPVEQIFSGIGAVACDVSRALSRVTFTGGSWHQLRLAGRVSLAGR